MGLEIMRHSASHILAIAVKRLFPGVKLGIGPAIENGFYYDFDLKHTFSQHDLEKIEKELSALIPKTYWKETQWLIKAHGKAVCKAPIPMCSKCPIEKLCPKKGVLKSA